MRSYYQEQVNKMLEAQYPRPEVVEPVKLPTLFKVLHVDIHGHDARHRLATGQNLVGYSAHGGHGKWDVPVEQPDGTWKPGRWRRVDSRVVPCQVGLHVATLEDLDYWRFSRGGEEFVYEVEVGKGEIVWSNETRGNKWATNRVRLLRRIDMSLAPVIPEDDREQRHIRYTSELKAGKMLRDEVRGELIADKLADRKLSVLDKSDREAIEQSQASCETMDEFVAVVARIQRRIGLDFKVAAAQQERYEFYGQKVPETEKRLRRYSRQLNELSNMGSADCYSPFGSSRQHMGAVLLSQRHARYSQIVEKVMADEQSRLDELQVNRLRGQDAWVEEVRRQLPHLVLESESDLADHQRRFLA